jgi:hypothetical protein
MSATRGETAALRRHYLWRATSVAFLSVAINLIYVTVTGAWPILWR